MLRILTVATALITTAFLGALPAAAQAVCSERAKFVDQLSGNYSENTVALGLVNNGSVLEILASKEGSWTILVTKPNGISCVVATGEAWEAVPHQLVSDPSA